MKKLTLDSPQHAAAIHVALDAAYGKIGEVLTLDDLRDAAMRYGWLTKKSLKGCTVRVIAHCSLPKAYRYSKEVGRATITHDGKGWVFVSADRVICYASQSVGGHCLAAAGPEQHAEITRQALASLNISVLA